LDPNRNLFGLSAQAKAQLIAKLASLARPAERSPPRSDPADSSSVAARLDLSELEGFREISMFP